MEKDNEKKFSQFDMENPDVWLMFERFTFELINRRKRRYSARGIFHRIRWETAIQGKDDMPFKLNNNWSPWYARKFIAKYPQHSDFFSTRFARADIDSED